MQFLNLIDVQLNKYTATTSDELDSLPNLEYTREILYRHIQKIQQVLHSIQNPNHPKWRKASNDVGRNAKTAAERLEQDFNHLHNQAETLHRRCNEAITVLVNSISISEFNKAIEQVKRVGKLIFLAFIFVPLSFSTSVLGMKVRELHEENLLIYWWIVLSVILFLFAITSSYCDFARLIGLEYNFLRWR